ncbi:MAG TPA: hypothetical protein VN842_00800 [Thermoplasmata archaeon]|nr:hypothetical protein [Thermoplasmata archaeon]
MGPPHNDAQRRFAWAIRLLFLGRLAVVVIVLFILIKMGVL